MSSVTWEKPAKADGRLLHSMCSYMAMFPPAIPHHFVLRYSEPGGTVLDPFSGRGTAPLEACTLGRVGIGNDKSPLAYVLTFAKTNTPRKGWILARLGELEKGYASASPSIEGIDAKIRMIFHDETLKELVYLRDCLDWRGSNVDAFVTAMILGIMHGNSEGYLSLRMPNTFSMSPNYVKGYIAEHKLERNRRETFVLLKKKLERCYQRPRSQGRAYNRDARHLGWIDDESVDLVVTSPPYTRVIRYGAFNWIRLWFLQQDAKELDGRLLCTQSLSKYLAFMGEVLEEMHRVVVPKGKVVLVIGDVRDKVTDVDLNLADEVWEHAAKPLDYKLVDTITDEFNEGMKVSRIWGEQKRGRATKTDRILILERS